MNRVVYLKFYTTKRRSHIRDKSEIQKSSFELQSKSGVFSVCGRKNLTNYRDLLRDPILSKSWDFFRTITIICCELCV